MFRLFFILLATLLGFACTPIADAQQLFAFPKKGQSQDQQNKDRFECHSFASQQSGFDPSAPAPPPPSTTTTARRPRSDAEVRSAGRGSALRGAAGGALLGAGIGAISGRRKRGKRAGKGAGIGAGIGLLAGAGRGRRKQEEARRRQKEEQEAVRREQQQNLQRQQGYLQQQQQKRQNYNRAWTACMEAKNYNVK